MSDSLQLPIHPQSPGTEPSLPPTATERAATIPASIATLDDAVLVYDSEIGHADDASAAPAGEHVCCGSTESPDDIDRAPYTEVVFKGERRGYFLNGTGIPLERDTWVIVEAEKGVDLGVVGSTGYEAWQKTRLRVRPCDDSPKRVTRLAEDKDLRILRYHREQEQTAFTICLDKIHKLGLPMKLVDVEFQFDRNRITFYFTADGRVDFRELVRELAAEYRTRIELRQIGPRDEARRMGGYGVCGRELCCNSWLGTFEPISTDMARLQNLALNPFKLAGQCGRLKCCLAYEMQVYEDLLHRFPPLEYTIQTERGPGRIEKIDIFQDAIYVHYARGDAWERMTLEQVRRYMPEGGPS